jgi:peptidoglycan/xylan/chitin deacetylase (PgdA/CDA1 family)
VSQLPPHIAVRRREQRARRRRRRRLTSLGICLAVLAAGTLVLTTQGVGGLAGHGGSRASTASGHRTLVAGVPQAGLGSSPKIPGGRGGLAAVIAAGNAEINRLAALNLPVYCGGPHGNEVAFTFDDGPGVLTHLAVRKLRQAKERATFFVVGRSIHNFPGYLGRELKVAAIGDHTYTHPDLIGLPPTQVRFQLERTAQKIRAESGKRVNLWRPPYEAADAAVRRVAQQLGMLEILWSVDSRDWFGASWDQIVKIVETGLRPGAIVLFHENHGQTIRALTTLLPYLRRHHLRSVSLPQLFASDPPSVTQLRRGSGGCGEPNYLRSGIGVARG